MTLKLCVNMISYRKRSCACRQLERVPKCVSTSVLFIVRLGLIRNDAYDLKTHLNVFFFFLQVVIF